MYNNFMRKYMNILLKLFHYKHIDEAMVSRLYVLSQKSIIALMLFPVVLVYYLYPVLGVPIIIWWIIFMFLSFVRLYLAYARKKDLIKFQMLTWYKLFVIGAFSTATLFSLLGSVGFFYLNEVQQMLVAISLIGLSAGSMSSLFPDIRIVIGYTAIVIVPMIVSLLLLGSSIHLILALLVAIYFVTQITIILNTYKQNSELEKRKDDIHKEELKLLKKEEALDYFFDQAPIGIFSYDMDLKVTDTNQAFLDLFGLRRGEMIGNNLKNLPDKRPLSVLENALHKAETYSGPYRSIKGYDLWVEAQCFPVHNYYEDIVGGICLIENKTKEHEALKEIKYLASHDPLTSLLNRRGLKEYVSEFMKKDEHKYLYSLIVYLDLNKFKHINDSLGHKAGDRLLIAVAERLKVSIKESCLLSRFGGDEFIVVSPFVADNRQDAEKESTSCIGRIQQAFLEPFTIDTMKLSIKTSLGIVIIEPNNSNIDEIIRFADIAMYQAKRSTSDHVSYYNTDLDAERKRIFTLQHGLLSAAEKNELKVYLQPLVAMKNNQLLAAESLLRWEHPTLGFLSPVEFIPIAIETGLISEITWWLIEEVCKYIHSLKQQNLWKLNYISINVNAKQLLLKYFVDQFLDMLSKYELSTSDILIEITERSIIDNFEDTQDVIDILRKEGIKCAIDDFGIGYSSLSYLKKLSFDTLKIDMEFIKDIESNSEDIALIRTILEIGKHFHYHIVVEGIEEETQRELLLAIDEDLVYQGFLFSKPMLIDTFAEKYLKV